MRLRTQIALLLVAFLPAVCPAKDYRVSFAEVASVLRTAAPGDRLLIKDGIERDASLKWEAKGTSEKPVIIEAEHHGKAVVSGRSSLQIAGNHIEIRGLLFKDGYPERRSVVEFSIGNDYANHCRLTDCVIDNFNTNRRDENKTYVMLAGRYNRIDHCSFLRKYNLGVTLIVNLNGKGCLQNRHQIDHNYFGPRGVYASNGAETIRVGTSQQSYESSQTLIEHNLFDQCSGEVEVISIKSCDNIIRNNVLFECQGVLALRHGKRNIVEKNLFLGNHVRNTGGVRIVDSDHIVRENTFVNLAGHRFFSPLAVMNAVPNSLPNRYVQPKNVTISGNTFIGCSKLEFGTGADSERTLAPTDIYFCDNRFLNDAGGGLIDMIDKDAKIIFAKNLIEKSSTYSHEGFEQAKLKAPKIPDISAIRKGVGASWYVPSGDAAHELSASSEIQVYPTEDLAQVLKSAKPGSKLMLHEGVYQNDATLYVDKPVSIIGAGMDQVVLRYKGRNAESILTIADGGVLYVKGVTFDGTLTPGATVPAAGISTAENMIRPYGLVVEACGFCNYGENDNSCIRGTKATFADTVIIRNCRFYDSAGSGINYAEERDDKGRYNVDDLIIDNCSFSHFLGIPINVYRGGSDESTAGPYVRITHCNFYDCCNKQRGSVLRLIGPQLLEISHCNFDGSGRGGASVRLDEAVWEEISIHDCNLWNAGKILSVDDRVITGPILHVKPDYLNAGTWDFRLLPTSVLKAQKIGLK